MILSPLIIVFPPLCNAEKKRAACPKKSAPRFSPRYGQTPAAQAFSLPADVLFTSRMSSWDGAPDYRPLRTRHP
jgi:hypothetical protein